MARVVWSVGICDPVFLSHWVRLEGFEGNLGEFTSPKPFTARWIARQAWSMGVSDYHFFRHWGLLEAQRGYLGDFDDPAPFSARWALRQPLRKPTHICLH